ncbi:MAG TPA: glycosyltransferase family 4 protein [Candidatus Paceibacterota bacterium]|jgi:glycosyltransferase involved in cell wall biosynthesis|nr:glycosyltransferase family 4 protein [Candidatus Paceibacterota bacterium]
MTPRRILIFSFAYYPRFVGGAEVAIKEITDRIAPQTIEFDLVCLRLDSRLPAFERIGNVNVYRVGFSQHKEFSTDSLPWYLHINKYFYLFTGARKALSLHRKRKYDAIWSLMATYSSFAAVIFKMIKPKVPFIFTLQDGDPIPYIKRKALPLYPLFKMMFTRADHIQTISTYLADWAKEMGATCPITVVPNAVDFKLFSTKESPEQQDALKEKLGKKEGDTFVITTSRLVVKNAVNDVIDALSYLPENVRFIILGQGYQEKQLKKQVAELELQDRVQFLGYVPHKEMPKYLHVSDIFIRPSLSEGFGNSFIEAMAAEVPVIATPVGGITDFLVEGETGLFCDVHSPRSIAQKVEKLIRDKESRDYIVARAKKMVQERYDWNGIVERMQDIFLSM